MFLSAEQVQNLKEFLLRSLCSNTASPEQKKAFTELRLSDEILKVSDLNLLSWQAYIAKYVKRECRKTVFSLIANYYAHHAFQSMGSVTNSFQSADNNIGTVADVLEKMRMLSASDAICLKRPAWSILKGLRRVIVRVQSLFSSTANALIHFNEMKRTQPYLDLLAIPQRVQDRKIKTEIELSTHLDRSVRQAILNRVGEYLITCIPSQDFLVNTDLKDLPDCLYNLLRCIDLLPSAGERVFLQQIIQQCMLIEHYPVQGIVDYVKDGVSAHSILLQDIMVGSHPIKLGEEYTAAKRIYAEQRGKLQHSSARSQGQASDCMRGPEYSNPGAHRESIHLDQFYFSSPPSQSPVDLSLRAPVSSVPRTPPCSPSGLFMGSAPGSSVDGDDADRSKSRPSTATSRASSTIAGAGDLSDLFEDGSGDNPLSLLVTPGRVAVIHVPLARHKPPHLDFGPHAPVMSQ